jgi:peroxiredoxin
MFNRLILPILGAALLATSGLGAAEAAVKPAAQSTQEQKTLHPKVFQFTDIAGRNVELLVSDQGIKLLSPKDKAAVLMFYIHSGTPCRKELQLFTKLKPDLKDLEFVTFELKGFKPEELKAFEKELKLKGLYMIDSAQALPFAKFIAQLTNWPGSVPFIIGINKKGEVKYMQLGALNEEQLKKLVEALQK